MIGIGIAHYRQHVVERQRAGPEPQRELPDRCREGMGLGSCATPRGRACCQYRNVVPLPSSTSISDRRKIPRLGVMAALSRPRLQWKSILRGRKTGRRCSLVRSRVGGCRQSKTRMSTHDKADKWLSAFNRVQGRLNHPTPQPHFSPIAQEAAQRLSKEPGCAELRVSAGSPKMRRM